MQRNTRYGVGLAAVMVLSLACGAAPGAAGGGTLDARLSGAGGHDRDEAGGRKPGFAFKQLRGVARPYTGAANAIRGVAGGGLPWVVMGASSARLSGDSVLEVEVEGLVFDPTDAAVIARGVGGTNTVAQAKAIVSCQTIQDGAAAAVNVETPLATFTTGPAQTGGGNFSIEAKVTLPTPCYAPVVFVTSPAGAWFAVSGF